MGARRSSLRRICTLALLSHPPEEKRADLICELLGVRVSKSTVWRAGIRLGYTPKKDRWVQQKETSAYEQPGG